MSAHNGDGRDRAESMSIDADSMTKRDRVIPKTEIVKEGALVKLGGVRKNWKKRWFVLSASEIAYYSKSPATGGTFKGGIVLSAVSEVRTATAEEVGGKAHGILIRTPGRNYKLHTTSDAIRDDWVLAITATMKAAALAASMSRSSTGRTSTISHVPARREGAPARTAPQRPSAIDAAVAAAAAKRSPVTARRHTLASSAALTGSADIGADAAGTAPATKPAPPRPDAPLECGDASDTATVADGAGAVDGAGADVTEAQAGGGGGDGECPDAADHAETGNVAEKGTEESGDTPVDSTNSGVAAESDEEGYKLYENLDALEDSLKEHKETGKSFQVRATFDFSPEDTGELGFERGDILEVCDATHSDWWLARIGETEGHIPSNRVRALSVVGQPLQVAPKLPPALGTSAPEVAPDAFSASDKKTNDVESSASTDAAREPAGGDGVDNAGSASAPVGTPPTKPKPPRPAPPRVAETTTDSSMAVQASLDASVAPTTTMPPSLPPTESEDVPSVPATDTTGTPEQTDSTDLPPASTVTPATESAVEPTVAAAGTTNAATDANADGATTSANNSQAEPISTSNTGEAVLNGPNSEAPIVPANSAAAAHVTDPTDAHETANADTSLSSSSEAAGTATRTVPGKAAPPVAKKTTAAPPVAKKTAVPPPVATKSAKAPPAVQRKSKTIGVATKVEQ